jgi:hypothetical protein
VTSQAASEPANIDACLVETVLGTDTAVMRNTCVNAKHLSHANEGNKELRDMLLGRDGAMVSNPELFALTLAGPLWGRSAVGGRETDEGSRRRRRHRHCNVAAGQAGRREWALVAYLSINGLCVGLNRLRGYRYNPKP